MRISNTYILDLIHVLPTNSFDSRLTHEIHTSNDNFCSGSIAISFCAKIHSIDQMQSFILFGSLRQSACINPIKTTHEIIMINIWHGKHYINYKELFPCLNVHCQQLFLIFIQFEINTSEIPSPDFNCQINCFKYTQSVEEKTKSDTNGMGSNCKTKTNRNKKKTNVITSSFSWSEVHGEYVFTGSTDNRTCI